MANQAFEAPVLSGPLLTDATAINTTTTATQLYTTSIFGVIPALDMHTEATYRVVCGGIITTTATPTATVTPVFGTSATLGSNLSLGASPTWTLGTLAASTAWHCEFEFTVRSTGLAASGSAIQGSGLFVVNGAAGAIGQAVALGGASVTTADHTTSQGLGIFFTWGTNSASNSIQCRRARLSRIA